MDFNTPIFLGFFAAVALLTYCVPRQAKPYLLLVASYVFYMYKPENARLVALLVSVTVVTWCAGVALGSRKLRNVWARRAFLWLALAVALGILFFYKYFDFFGQLAADIGAIFGGSGKFASLDLIAPLGLSYFTFQSLGYVIDVYQHKARPQLNLFKYALFVSFFACIFTGPIERAEHLMPQLENPRPFNYSRMAGGAFRMLWGYFKKMVLADGIGQFVSAVYGGASTAAGPYLVAASLLFSYQIYLDFSGCCDIAIGGARILGVDLLENFNRPFAATSYTELWNRWHMSLTNWFRDYIFTPLAFYNRGLPGVWGKLAGLVQRVHHLPHQRPVARGQLGLCHLGRAERPVPGGGQSHRQKAAQAGQKEPPLPRKARQGLHPAGHRLPAVHLLHRVLCRRPLRLPRRARCSPACSGAGTSAGAPSLPACWTAA